MTTIVDLWPGYMTCRDLFFFGREIILVLNLLDVDHGFELMWWLVEYYHKVDVGVG